MVNRFKMMVFAALVACAALAAAQPCHEDHTCFDGHFCDTQAGYTCRQCLRCEDLKREEPPLKNPCVKSVAECGPCLKDLVDSRVSDLTCAPRENVPPEANDFSTYWIVAIVLFVALVLVAAAVAIRFMLKKMSIFKLHLDTNIGATLPMHATAPECPPPPYPTPHALDFLRPGEDTKLPLITQYQPPFPDFEPQDYQTGTVYNPPAYVRLPANLPETPREPEVQNDVNDNRVLQVDEDTSPSQWAPGPNYNNSAPREPEVRNDVNEETSPSAWAPGPNYSAGDPAVNGVSAISHQQDAGAGAFSNALAVARHTDLILPPGTHRMHQPMNENHEPNGEEEQTHHNGHGRAGAGAGGPSACTSGNGLNANANYNVMNVNQFITIVKPP